MEYQLSLFNVGLEKKESEASTVKIIAWNIQNSSKIRANKQFMWIYEMNPDIIVLTEVKLSEGFALLKSELEMQNNNVIYSESDSYFTVIAIRKFMYKCTKINLSKSSERVNYVEVKLPIGEVELVGVYAPACGNNDINAVNKMRFHEELYTEVVKSIWKQQPDKMIMILGDLNFLEPNHEPKYLNFSNYFKEYTKFNESPFKDLYRVFNKEGMEYSWIGQGIYQRLDHVFVTENLVSFVNKIEYLHEPRVTKLSDHSAMLIEITDVRV